MPRMNLPSSHSSQLTAGHATQHSAAVDADTEAAQRLSALADGEVPEPAHGVQQLCDEWARSPALRERWHTYHLIGDVMRSEELASAPDADAAFMLALRARLANEPVVLAPTLSVGVAGSPRSVKWRMGAVAAGFVLVAGALVVSRLGPSGADLAQNAAVLASKAKPALTLAGNEGGAGGGAVSGSASQTVIRDARLDDYLRAHQGARGGAAALPGGGLRNVDMFVSGGAQR